MPVVCCGGCCLVDFIPDCCDQGPIGKCCDFICCKTASSTNFDKNDPDNCCCGMCSKPCKNCCKCCGNECRLKWCIWSCCCGNWIVDFSAPCCGEYKGNLAHAEKDLADKGAPAVQTMEV